MGAAAMMTTAELPIPETRYAYSDGLSIAYQVFGQGTQDLVVVPGIMTNVEGQWDSPEFRRMYGLFARSFRVIFFDKRGQGMSDAFEGAPTLEQRMDDVRAVMQSAGSRRAVLFGWSEGGAMAALFTATYPAVVERLVLYAAMARFTGSEDYPHRPGQELMIQSIMSTWGKPESVKIFAPSRADDAAFCQHVARLCRQTASPNAMCRLIVANDQIDVRAVLPLIRRPTLVMHRRRDRTVKRENGRFLADQIPDAVYLELPGNDHICWAGDIDAFAYAVTHFAGLHISSGQPDHSGRWLATVLFTDIVNSTEKASTLGDAAWRDLLQRFHAMGREQLAAHRGQEIDSAGDGMFASFDGPARAIRCAAAMTAEAKKLGFDLRAGLHTGEVEATGEKVSGMAVHIGARVMAQAGAGEVLVSSTVKDLVAGSGIGFEPRGAHNLKGVPGDWLLHRALVA
jgi:pimeloyl-ACP methyl ester carboxylesterase